jgi:hypothetical protein
MYWNESGNKVTVVDLEQGGKSGQFTIAGINLDGEESFINRECTDTARIQEFRAFIEFSLMCN